MMQRQMGEIAAEIQPIGQQRESVGVAVSLLCGAAFHVSGIRDKGSGLYSDFHGPQVLLPSWPLFQAKT